MTTHEIDELFVPALENIMGHLAVTHKGAIDFSSKIGETMINEFVGWATSNSTGNKPLPDNLRQLLTQLKGPYGKTIFKAYLIYKEQRKLDDFRECEYKTQGELFQA